MGSLLQNLIQRFEALFQIDYESVPKSRRILLRAGQLAYLFGRKFHQDLALERASSLAFAATISVIPLGVILFMLFHDFGQFDAQVQGLADAFVDRFVAAEESSLAGNNPEQLTEDAPDEGAEKLERRNEVRAWVDGFLDRLRAPLKRSGAVTPLALIGLLIAGSSLFRTMERNFSAVWHVQVNRGYFRRIASFWLMLTAIPILLGLSFVPDFLAASSSPVLDLIRGTVVPIVVAFFGFVTLFTQLPNARVKVNAAAVGALGSGVVWVLGTQLFTYYIQTWANQSVYGALGVVPFFLVWVYYSWLVALNGCELSYCVQNFPVLEREVRYHVGRQQVTRFVHALVVMERVYRGFADGASSPTAEQVATELQTPLADVEEMLERLRSAELLVDDVNGRLLPARSPASLPLSAVADVFPKGVGFHLPQGASPATSAIADLVEELRRNVRGRLERLTFEDLLQGPAPKALAVDPDAGVTNR
ncbi:MAG: YihY/virulence factor BrkB family protein [Planctomycetota bacterium]